MDRLTIHLLGSVTLHLDDGPPVPLPAGKASALLAYLAVEASRPHSRQALAELLWPERADAEALSALRFALSNLRAALHDRSAVPPCLLVDRSHVQLNPQAKVWVDVTTFREQATLCETEIRAGNPPALAALQAALAPSRGPFLQGFNLGDSLNFESWALRTREQLELQRLRLLRFLGSGQEAACNYAQAAETYRTLLDIEPWDEDAHRHLMRALAANGEHSAALAQYAACRRALSDLGIEPGRATNTLHQRLRQEASAETAGATGSTDEPAGAPFVARERELKRLSAALERALAGQGQVVVVTGEAGSGKTALLSAFAHQALARHPKLLIASGRCDAYAGKGRPYQPFIESVQMLAGGWEALPWANQLAPESRDRLTLAAPQIAQALVEKAPDLLQRFVNRPELAQRIQIQSETSRPLPAWRKALRNGTAPSAAPVRLEAGVLFEQVARFLAALASQQPLVLLLDDLQWVDAGSAALLFHLARRFAYSQVLLVVAYRSGEVSDQTEMGRHPLLGIVTELQRYGGDIHVDLDQADERAFIAAFLEQDPLLHPNRLDEAFRTALAQRTGGNPLFTIELLRSLQGRDEIRRAADGTWVSNPALKWERVPERVEAAIAGRIAQLSTEWRDRLSTAAVEGDSFTAEVLARVHGVDAAELLRDLSGPLGMAPGARRLIQGEGVLWLEDGDEPQRLSRYRFRHNLIQTYLYQRLDPVERAQRHAAVGFALEAVFDGQTGDRARHAAELARHFESGGLSRKAAAYHLEAGRQAVYLASPQDAVAHYRRGLDLLSDQPHTVERDRLEIHLHLALGAPFLSASGWGGPERHEAIQRALELLQATDRADTHPPDAEWDALLLALYAQGDWLISQGEMQRAVRIGEQILALPGAQARPPQTHLSQALASRLLGLSALFQGRFTAARQQLTHALTAYYAIGQPDNQPWSGSDLDAGCRTMLGFVLAVSGYLDQAWAQTSQALNRVRRTNRPSSLGTPLIFACEVAILRGDLPALQALAGELLRVGQTEELRVFLAYGWAAEGYIRALQAEPGSEQAEASLELIRRGMRLWESTGTKTGFGLWIVRLADACLQAGDVAAGLAVTTAALTTPDQPGIEAGLARIYRLHGELLLKQESADRSAAEAFFIKALDTARQQEAHTLELRAATSLAKLWQSVKPEAARRLLADTYAWFTEGLDTPDLVAAREWLARLKSPDMAGPLIR